MASPAAGTSAPDTSRLTASTLVKGSTSMPPRPARPQKAATAPRRERLKEGLFEIVSPR